MTAAQPGGTRAGRGPAMDVERIYRTTISAEELAQALADHFRAQEFETQVFRTSENRTVMQARKESLWRHLLGVAYAVTVVFTPGEGQLSVDLGGTEWVDAAVSGAIGLVAVPPVLLGTAYGIWKENQLDQEVWRVIDQRISAAEPFPPTTGGMAAPSERPSTPYPPDHGWSAGAPSRAARSGVGHGGPPFLMSAAQFG